MATEAQIAANRANAKKSTGPRTVDGKIRAARNAVRHALSAGYAILRIEAPDELERLTADAVEQYRPVGAEEMYAVERIALAKLAVLRAARLEAGMFTCALNDALNDNNCTPYVSLHPVLESNADAKREQTRNFALADGFDRMSRRSNSWSLYLRYQSQAERLYRRAIEAYDDVRKRREAVSPNEANFEPQLEESAEHNEPDGEPNLPPAEANPAEPAPAAWPPPVPDSPEDPPDAPKPPLPPDKMEGFPKQIT